MTVKRIDAGVINRLKTLADGTIRLEVDIPRECCPDDILNWLYESVIMLRDDGTKVNG